MVFTLVCGVQELLQEMLDRVREEREREKREREEEEKRLDEVGNSMSPAYSFVVL